MKAFRDFPRAEISVRRKMDAPLARYRNIKTELLPIGLHAKEVEPLAPGAKVIRLFRSIEFRVEGVK